MSKKELFEGWRRAVLAASAWDRTIAPNGRYDLCEDWQLQKLETLDREAGAWKLAYIQAD